MKKVILLLSFLTLIILSEQNLYACSCGIGERQDYESLSEDAFSQMIKPFEAIFIGRVVKKQMVGDEMKVTFEIKNYWKGISNRKVIVYTSPSEASCGVPYKLSKNYLVPALNIEGKLRTGLCTHTPFNQFQDIFLKKLGAPLLPSNRNK